MIVFHLVILDSIESPNQSIFLTSAAVLVSKKCSRAGVARLSTLVKYMSLAYLKFDLCVFY